MYWPDTVWSASVCSSECSEYRYLVSHFIAARLRDTDHVGIKRIYAADNLPVILIKGNRLSSLALSNLGTTTAFDDG